jgi:ATP-binding cassette subfamily B protein RaxB
MGFVIASWGMSEAQVAKKANESKHKNFAAQVTTILQFGWRRQLPIVMQAEANECGLACIAMVGSYYGHDLDLPGLRQRFSSSQKGTNLTRVMAIAARLSMDGRPLKLDLNCLGHLQRPCILHWDLNHFVVLKEVSARRIIIHDPARGVRVLSYLEASNHFTGVALELTPKAEFKPVKVRRAISLKALTGSLRGVVSAMTQILMLAIVLEVFNLIGPFYLQWVLDHVLVSADHDLLTLLGAGFIAVNIFQAVISAARSWLVAWLGATVNVQWASNMVGHLLKLPLDWFEKRHIGDLVSRLGSIQTVQKTLTTQFIGSLLDGLMSLITLVLMGFYSLRLTGLVFSIFLVYALLRWAFFSPLRRANEDQIVYAARQQSELLEGIRGILPIKLANQQDVRRIRYANAAIDTTNHEISIQRLTITFNAINQLLFGVGRVVLVWVAATLTLGSGLSVGMLVAFIAYADQFVSRASSLIDKLVDFRMLKLHAERLADIALSRVEANQERIWDGPLADASIEVRNVSFRYAEDGPWVLKNCNLRVGSGQSVAISGASGGGKTTLAKIILGLLEPTEGEVLFGGVPIQKLGYQYYRDMIGAVMQDDQLFAGSIADNIALGEPELVPDRIVAAADLAAIHEDISAMPMGYQSLIGDMGSSLSGGQKQRVILARALYRLPRLLVLDEATSHLDLERERLVSSAISELDITRIFIAHRPETVASADRVVVLRSGNLELIVRPTDRSGRN